MTILQASVNPEPEAVSWNQKIDEQKDSPKSFGEILKNDGATSSKGEVQTDQTNQPVFNYEVLTMTRHDQTNDVVKPAAVENVVLQSNQGM